MSHSKSGRRGWAENPRSATSKEFRFAIRESELLWRSVYSSSLWETCDNWSSRFVRWQPSMTVGQNALLISRLGNAHLFDRQDPGVLSSNRSYPSPWSHLWCFRQQLCPSPIIATVLAPVCSFDGHSGLHSRNVACTMPVTERWWAHSKEVMLHWRLWMVQGRDFRYIHDLAMSEPGRGCQLCNLWPRLDLWFTA